MRRVVAIAVSLTPLSCHTVLRPTACPPDVEPSARSAVGWEHVANQSGAKGVVSRLLTLHPVAGARVDLLPVGENSNKAIIHGSNAQGEVLIDSLRPGKYLLRVRAIGFRPASDTVLTVADSGLSFRALMATDVMILDGCGYGLIEHRVPWWVRK